MTERLIILAALTTWALSVPAGEIERAQGAASAPQPEVYVMLRRTAHITGDAVQLGDIAAMSGSGPVLKRLGGLTVNRLMQPGKATTVTQQDILNILQQAGISPELYALSGSTCVEVTSTAVTPANSPPQTVPSKKQEGKARQKVAGDVISTEAIKAVEKYFRSFGQLDVSINLLLSLEDKEIPTGPYQLEPEMGAFRPGTGIKKINVAIFQGTQKVLTVPVPLKLTVRQDVAVAIKQIQKDDPLDKENIALQNQEIHSLASWDPVDIRLLATSRAKTSIPAGSVLTRTMLEIMPVIHKGDRVTVELNRGLLNIKTTGEARNDAAPGESIRIRLLDSGAEVIARAVQPGQVEL